MSSIGAIALSGMHAALLRLSASADNIANARSNGPLPGAANAADYPPAYVPVKPVQSSNPGGGTQARVVPMLTGGIPMYDPSAPYADDQGMVAAPDVDLAGEMIELVTARYAFIANLKVMETETEMSRALFGVKA